MATAAMEETYADVEQLLWHQVHRFVERHGGVPEELKAIADETFVRVYHSPTFDPSRSKFSTYLTAAVRNRFMDELRRRGTNREFAIDPDELQNLPGRRDTPGFDLAEFVGGLREDVATVVRLVVETPAELADALAGARGRPRFVRGALRRHLRGVMRWSHRRVSRAFRGVVEALA